MNAWHGEYMTEKENFCAVMLGLELDSVEHIDANRRAIFEYLPIKPKNAPYPKWPERTTKVETCIDNLP